jgi:hypothetical protein
MPSCTAASATTRGNKRPTCARAVKFSALPLGRALQQLLFLLDAQYSCYRPAGALCTCCAEQNVLFPHEPLRLLIISMRNGYFSKTQASQSPASHLLGPSRSRFLIRALR